MSNNIKNTIISIAGMIIIFLLTISINLIEHFTNKEIEKLRIELEDKKEIIYQLDLENKKLKGELK